MKIAIDISVINPSKAGIGYYAQSIVEALIKKDSENTYVLVTNDKKNSEFKLPKNFTILEVPSERGSITWIWKVSRILNKEGFDALISPSNFSFAIFFPRTIQIIHD